MPHIHTGAGEHDPTSSAYIVLEQKDAVPKLWLHRHKKLHMWLQFGGHVELQETPWAALQHELREESGYELTQLKILQPVERLDSLTGAKSHPLPVNENTHDFNGHEFRHYHTDRAYAFVTSELPLHKPEEGESKETLAMTAEEIKEIAPGDIPESTREVALFILKIVTSPNFERVDPTIYPV